MGKSVKKGDGRIEDLEEIKRMWRGERKKRE